MSGDAMLDAAIAYARLGYRVFPVHTIVDGTCGCGDLKCTSPGKHPATARGHKDATSDEADVAAFWQQHPGANIGIECTKRSGVLAIDIDPRNGGFDTEAELWGAEDLPEYVEWSTGGGGLHRLFKHPGGSCVATLGPGIDVKANGYIVAPPSIHASGRPYGPVDLAMLRPVANLPGLPGFISVAKPAPPPPPPPETHSNQDRDHALTRASAYLAKMDPAVEGAGGHSALFAAATAMVHGFELPKPTAIEILATEFNPRCSPPWDLSNAASRREFERKVDEALSQPHKHPKGWLLNQAASPTRTNGKHSPAVGNGKPSDVIEAATPEALAQWLTDKAFRDAGGRLVCRYWRGDFYVFRVSHYVRVSSEEIDRTIRRACSNLWTPKRKAGEPVSDDKGQPVYVKVQMAIRLVAEIIAAMRAVDGVFVDELHDAPVWLDGAEPPVDGRLIAMPNGLLHVNSRKLYPCSPSCFCTYATSFEYDADAESPAWRDFMSDLWPEDQTSIDTLAEVVGLLVVGDTSHQKVFLFIGPKRSGKGTTADVIKAIIGKRNFASPTLNNFGYTFGLESLIGRPVAIIDDARLSGRADQSAIAERLLTISGEGSLDVQRKNRPAWTGQLATQFLIISNELPMIGDSSGALASRFFPIVTRESFYGREDRGLRQKLIAELPGIFNWVLEGLDRLHRRGHLRLPETSEQAIAELEELGSPVLAFLRDRCVEEPGASVLLPDLFAAWRDWCSEHGRDSPGTEASLSRRISAAKPSLGRSNPRVWRGAKEKRTTQIEGIRLA